MAQLRHVAQHDGGEEGDAEDHDHDLHHQLVADRVVVAGERGIRHRSRGSREGLGGSHDLFKTALGAHVTCLLSCFLFAWQFIFSVTSISYSRRLNRSALDLGMFAGSFQLRNSFLFWAFLSSGISLPTEKAQLTREKKEIVSS